MAHAVMFKGIHLTNNAVTVLHMRTLEETGHYLHVSRWCFCMLHVISVSTCLSSLPTSKENKLPSQGLSFDEKTQQPPHPFQRGFFQRGLPNTLCSMRKIPTLFENLKMVSLFRLESFNHLGLSYSARVTSYAVYDSTPGQNYGIKT